MTDAPNLQQFPVTPGADYTFDAPMSVTANGELAGYVILIFMDSANKNIKGDILWFHPTVVGLGAPTTDADGCFRIATPPDVAQAGVGSSRLPSGGAIRFVRSSRRRLGETSKPTIRADIAKTPPRESCGVSSIGLRQMRMIQTMLTAAPTMPVNVSTMKKRSTQSIIT